jgi:glycosyltransferase involved in cell wall biosynthesis
LRIDSTISSIEPRRSKVKAVTITEIEGGLVSPLGVGWSVTGARVPPSLDGRRVPEADCTIRPAMRILMLAQTYAPVVGGEERLVEDLSRHLSRRGHEVTVATLRQPLGPPPQGEDGVRVELLESSVHSIPGLPVLEERHYAAPLPDPKTTAGLRRLLHRLRPDVVHAHNWLVNSYLPLARRADPPLVMSLHDFAILCPTKRLFYKGEVCSGPGPLKCMRHAFEYYGAGKGAMIATGTRLSEPWVRRRADMFISISAAVEELCRVRAQDCHRVIHNFVGELPPAPADADEQLSFLPDGPFVLYFGDVGEDKGAGNLIRAHRELGGAPPLVLIGRHRMEGLDREPGIVAPGALPHPLAIEALRRSLFSVAPSIWAEPFGIVALEAAAAGKPIVASDIGGLPDVVADGETGLLVPAGDRTALREALRRMIDNAEMRARMGAAAGERAKLFGPEVIVPQFEDAYRDAIAARLKREAGRGR